MTKPSPQERAAAIAARMKHRPDPPSRPIKEVQHETVESLPATEEPALVIQRTEAWDRGHALYLECRATITDRARVGPTEDQVALLGTDVDAVLAERWGVSITTVLYWRRARGIPAYAKIRPKQTTIHAKPMDALLGVVPDRAIAERYGCTIAAVYGRRRALGIASYREHEWARQAERMLTYTTGERAMMAPFQPFCRAPNVTIRRKSRAFVMYDDFDNDH